jgi:hypothetical protein
MTLPEEVLKTDVLGRVRVKKARRNALLDEFERGGASAQAFAQMVGVKYQTFASWVQQRRRARKQYPPVAKALPSTPATTGALRLVEALVEPTGTHADGALRVQLPGGASLEVHNARQAVLAADLLKALAPARSC